MILKLRPLSGEFPFAQLDLLYRHILLSCENVELALRIIGICLVSTQAIDVPWGHIYRYPSQITAPEYMETILGLDPGDVQRCLEDLGSLIEYKSDTEKLRVLHASLFDFLSDPARFLELAIDLPNLHTNLAIWCSHLDSHRNNFQIPDLNCEFNIPL